MSDNPLSGKVGLDTTEFKTGIAQMNRDIRVIESGFRANAAALGDWSKTASGLEMRMGTLTEKIGVQQKKVAALQAEYARIKAEKGENSKAAQEMEIRLNKETEALNKSQAEMRQTEEGLKGMAEGTQEAEQGTKELGDEEEKTTQKTNILGSALDGLKNIAKVGIAAVLGLAGAVVGVAAGITKLVLSTADAAGELVDLSLKTGIGVEELQELRYVGDQTGTSLDTMTGSLAKLTRNMSQARDQSGDYSEKLGEAGKKVIELEAELAKTPVWKDRYKTLTKQLEDAKEALDEIKGGDVQLAFGKLGISVTDVNGNLRDSKVVFYEAIDALGKIQNETERDALAMSIFGKSAMELNPLIKAGSDEINRLSQEARDMGAVMEEEDVGAMESFGDQLAGLKAGLMGTLGTLAGAFLPGFQNLATTGGGYLKQFSSIVKGSNGDLATMATGIGGLLGQIVSDITKQGPQMLQAGLGIIQGIINAIVTSLPALLPGVITMIMSLVEFILQNLPMVLNAGIQIILALVNGIGMQLPMLINAAIQMLVTLAQGVAQALPQLMPVIATIIPQVILTLIENLPKLIEAAIQLIMALANGIVAALPILIQQGPVIVTALVNAIRTSLPMLIIAALKLIQMLVEGLIQFLPMIATAAVKMVMALIEGLFGAQPKLREAANELIGNILKIFTDTLPDLIAMGAQIVEGVWEGIQGMAATFMKNVTAFFTDIVAAAKKALGIKSPSMVFAGIGENMALGLGEGFGESFRNIQRNVADMVGSLGNGLMGIAPQSLAYAPTRGERGEEGRRIQVNVYATVANEIDVDRMAYRVVEILQRAAV